MLLSVKRWGVLSLKYCSHQIRNYEIALSDLFIMEDSVHNHVQTLSSEAVAGSVTSRWDSKLTLVASGSKPISHTLLNQIPLFNNGKIRKLPVHGVGLFLLKVGALEIVRRLSKARCPSVWSGLQALQVFCYPPLKWLQRWDPLKNLIKGAQVCLSQIKMHTYMSYIFIMDNDVKMSRKRLHKY